MNFSLLNSVASFLIDSGCFSEKSIYSLAFNLSPNEERLEEIKKTLSEKNFNVDDCYALFWNNEDFETYEKEINNPIISEDDFIKRKFFRPSFETYRKNIKDLDGFLQKIKDKNLDEFRNTILMNEIFQSLNNMKDLLIFGSHNLMHLGKKIHLFDYDETGNSDIDLIFDEYYFREKISDRDYYYFLSHPKSHMFLEKIVASMQETCYDDEEIIYEKILNLVLTIYIKDIEISEETKKLISSKNPKITIEHIYLSNGFNFSKFSINDCQVLKDLVLKRINDKNTINFNQIVSNNKFKFTNKTEMILDLQNRNLEELMDDQ
jgi:hypothetical protein